jgi:calcineurin-like phosphoesterase family protein
MGRIRYTSDLHFQHALVAKLRGFTKLDINDNATGDTGEHDGVIIENFNSGTRDDDLTIIAGDFAMNWKGAEAKLAQLRGRLILVEGNHDIMSSIHADGWKHRAAWTGDGRFEAIVAYLPRKAAGRKFLISHYPYEGDHTGPDRYTQYRLRDEGLWLLHGHTHSGEKHGDTIRTEWLPQGSEMHWQYRGRQIHVGLDAWGLKPVPEETILDLMSTLEKERN